ncbi:MFS transporter [Actinoplanes teichomyceticus]|uniref:MDR family MFS transporter n=1 Tax=Actinoplanes teichomyceticus TaxID=1867 RepID=UPI001942EEDF|nr:MFS transporter [Actinoplanes teichomyceticus]GIF11027.1 MFS transporter [Actinoplanes teichomyceticus]
MHGWLRQAAGGLPRQFWFLWTGTLINRLGSFVVLFLSIYLTGERHLTQSQAGLVLGLYGVGGAIGTMTGGVLADRWGRRPTMLTAQFGAAALMLALGFAQSYPQILVVTALLGLFGEGVRPAFSAMMVDVVPEADRVRAYSLNYWAINLGFALAAIAAGFAAQADYLLLFVVDAATTLLTATITLIFLAETRPAHRPAGDGTPAPRGGMLTALGDRVFLVYLLINLLSVLVLLQHASTLPIAMLADGFSAATYGWVIAVNGLLIVFGQLFVPRLIDGRRSDRVLAVGALIIGAGFGLVAVAHAAWMYALTVVIWTLGEMLQSPSNAATVAALSPPALRGRYQGLSSLSWSIGTALAPILGGLVLQGFGSAALWLGCFVLCALAAAGHLLAGPARERRAALRRTQELAGLADTPAATGGPAPAASPTALPPAAADGDPDPALAATTVDAGNHAAPFPVARQRAAAADAAPTGSGADMRAPVADGR